MTALALTSRRRGLNALLPSIRRDSWTIGLIVLLAVLLAFTKSIQPRYGVTGVQGLAISVLPLALAAVAQAIVVVSGGLDRSIGSMMALTNVVAAVLMNGQSEQFGVVAALIVLFLGNRGPGRGRFWYSRV
jgi:ribose transport system permease protein